MPEKLLHFFPSTFPEYHPALDQTVKYTPIVLYTVVKYTIMVHGQIKRYFIHPNNRKTIYLLSYNFCVQLLNIQYKLYVSTIYGLLIQETMVEPSTPCYTTMMQENSTTIKTYKAFNKIEQELKQIQGTIKIIEDIMDLPKMQCLWLQIKDNKMIEHQE